MVGKALGSVRGDEGVLDAHRVNSVVVAGGFLAEQRFAGHVGRDGRRRNGNAVQRALCGRGHDIDDPDRRYSHGYRADNRIAHRDLLGGGGGGGLGGRGEDLPPKIRKA